MAQALIKKQVGSGYHHYLIIGRKEGRLGGFPLPGWNEAGYLAANPAVRIAIVRGQYRSGFLHYAAVGRSDGRVGGVPPATLLEWLKLRWPSLHSWLFKAKEFRGLALFGHRPLGTPSRPSASRLCRPRSPIVASASGAVRRRSFVRWAGSAIKYRRWLTTGLRHGGFFGSIPRSGCIASRTRTTLMSGLDPFRFMVRRAHDQRHRPAPLRLTASCQRSQDHGRGRIGRTIRVLAA